MLSSYMLILVIGWCIVHFLMLRFLKEKTLRMICTAGLALWSTAVLMLTTFSRTPVLETRIQLIPFAGQNAYEVEQTIRGMIENAVMFFPLSGLLMGMFPKAKTWEFFLAGTVGSLCIELLQLLTHRGIAATEDLIANTIGCALGVLVTLLFRRLIHRK